jgi:uncharacterized Zn finger protein
VNAAKQEPKCPSCYIEGTHHIVSAESKEKVWSGRRGDDPWFYIIHCDTCGHVYSIIAKQVETATANKKANEDGYDYSYRPLK